MVFNLHGRATQTQMYTVWFQRLETTCKCTVVRKKLAFEDHVTVLQLQTTGYKHGRNLRCPVNTKSVVSEQ